MPGTGVSRDLAFISYSHKDADWLERIRILLKPYVRNGHLRVWDDRYIQVGQRWERDIGQALTRARVAVLLMSQNFAASDFIFEVELPALKTAAAADELTLFPIPVSTVDPDVVGLGEVQWARPPREALDLLDTPRCNQALTELALALVQLFRAATSQPMPSVVQWPPLAPPPARPVEPLRVPILRVDGDDAERSAIAGHASGAGPVVYDYACTACGHSWEAAQAISAAPLKTCPQCGTDHAKRQISSGPGFALHAGEWYADGYGSGKLVDSSRSQFSALEPKEGTRFYGVPGLPLNFIARAEVLAELKQALLGKEAARYGISSAAKSGLHGQGGIGKTVLATALVHDREVRDVFADGIYWITLGQEPNLIALQGSLLAMAGGGGSIESVNLGVVRLREALTAKQCLLVLDDVWQASHLEAFDVLGPRGRVLITTRDREMLSAAGTRPLDLGVLSPADARSLMARWVGIESAELPPIASEVAERCGYLPLALSVAAAMVADGTPWADLLTALRGGDIEFLHHAHHNVFATLSLSVRALSAEDQARYLELAIFPEDTEVPEQIVLRLWVAASLPAHRARRLLQRFADKALLSLRGEAANRVVTFHDLQGDYLRLVARDQRAAHARLLSATLESTPSADSVAARWALLSPNETYLWGHLFYHLQGAGELDTLNALITDVRWLNARVAANDVSALLTDLAQAADVGNPAARQVARALVREAGWLHMHPEALPSLLYNQLIGDGVPVAEAERITAGARPRMRLVHPVRFGEGRIFRGHSSLVTACAYSPDGTRVLSASHDKTLREWDRATAKELSRFEGHSNWVTACVYSPDGTRFLSASTDQTLREWDCATGKELSRFEGHSDSVIACAYSPDGTRVLSASSDQTLREWDRATGKEPSRFEGHSFWVSACAYSSDGTRVLSASSDQTLREWDRTTGREPSRFEGHSRSVTACAYSPDGTRVLSASKDKTLREWDRATTKELSRIEGHSDSVTACAYSPDGTRVLSASKDKTLREWDRATAKELSRFEGHSNWVTACVYSPDGTRFLSASTDQTLREWDCATGKELSRFEGHSDSVIACAYSPDGTRVLSASSDQTLREWDRATGKEPSRFEGHSFWVSACAYSSDGTRVLSASSDQTLREWDRTTGREPSRFEGHLDSMTACVYSRGGTCVLSASHDHTLRVWSRRSQRPIAELHGVAAFRFLTVTRGQLVAVDNLGNLWFVDCDDLV